MQVLPVHTQVNTGATITTCELYALERVVYSAECAVPYRALPFPLRALTYPIRYTLPPALDRMYIRLYIRLYIRPLAIRAPGRGPFIALEGGASNCQKHSR